MGSSKEVVGSSAEEGSPGMSSPPALRGPLILTFPLFNVVLGVFGFAKERDAEAKSEGGGGRRDDLRQRDATMAPAERRKEPIIGNDSG